MPLNSQKLTTKITAIGSTKPNRKTSVCGATRKYVRRSFDGFNIGRLLQIKLFANGRGEAFYIADQKYEKTTQTPDFFVETLMARG